MTCSATSLESEILLLACCYFPDGRAVKIDVINSNGMLFGIAVSRFGRLRCDQEAESSTPVRFTFICGDDYLVQGNTWLIRREGGGRGRPPIGSEFFNNQKLI